MRYGSLFSGGGGFDLAFCAAGFSPAWFCEIDPTARAVLARHWPEVPCYPDIRQLDGRALPRVDCIVAGFPCQDVSVAGNRAGLAGERTGLFWELARVIGECGPTWLVLENVPGLLSSNGTEDMGAVLWALGELGYGWAFRCLDARFFGLAQRRKRVFIVGHIGADIRGPAQVLFESEGRGGDSQEGGEAGKSAARGATAGAGESGDWYLADTLSVGADQTTGFFGPVVADTVRSHPQPDSNSVGNLTVGTLDTDTGRHGQNAFQGHLIANTIQASAGHHGHSSPRGDGGDNLVVASWDERNVTSKGNRTTVQYGAPANTLHADGLSIVSKSLSARQTRLDPSEETFVSSLATVRRLMPCEAEALQGWPRDFTRWTADGKELADGARYRLIGNGVAAPVAEWIARRIARASAAGGGA